MWDIKSKFTMKGKYGILYVAMNAASKHRQALNFVLHKSEKPFASCSHSYEFNRAEMSGRDIILKMDPSETLYFTSSTGLYSDKKFVQIGLFNIAEFMHSDPVVFSVARNSSLSGAVNPVIYNIILENDCSHYDILSNRFTVPSSGIYFFSFSVGITGGQQVECTMYVNNLPFTSIIHNSTIHNHTDVFGRAIMIHLNEADKIHIVNKGVARSSQLLETSFSGFKYDPYHGNMVGNFIIVIVFKMQHTVELKQNWLKWSQANFFFHVNQAL